MLSSRAGSFIEGGAFTESGGDMWGKRQRDDDWDGEHRDQPEDHRNQRPDDRRGNAHWDGREDRPGFGDPDRRGFGETDERGFGDSPWPESPPPRLGRPDFGGDRGFAERGYGNRAFEEPGYGDSRPGDGRRPRRDVPDAPFGEPAFGGRGGDFGGDARGGDRRDGDRWDAGRRDSDRRDTDRMDVDRRPADRRGGDRRASRDGGPWSEAGDWGQPEAELPIPVFTPAPQADSAAPAAVPPGNAPAGSATRPYGRLSIFTLHDDGAAEFDRLAEQAAEGVRMHEPDTLVYVMHVVPKAPMQRIIYEIYRDHAAFERHQRQPHIQQFEEGRRPCVLVTNIIDLRLKYAKVAPIQGVTSAVPGQASQGEPAAPSSSPAGARHRAPLAGQGAGPEGGWFGQRPNGRVPGQDFDWDDERSPDPAEHRSQDWGKSQYTGRRYRDN